MVYRGGEPLEGGCAYDVPPVELLDTLAKGEFDSAHEHGKSMFMRTIRLRSGEFEIVVAANASRLGFSREDGSLTRALTADLLHGAASHPRVARALRLALAQHGEAYQLRQMSDKQVVDELIRLLRSGRLVLRRVAGRAGPVAAGADPGPHTKAQPDTEPEEATTTPEPAPPPTPTTPPPETETWIEIVLLNDQGQPFVGEKCELTGPDGRRLGPFSTDSQGRVRVDGIEPGAYDVSFAELAATA